MANIFRLICLSCVFCYVTSAPVKRNMKRELKEAHFMMHSHVFGHRLCESGQMPIFGVCLGEGSDENNDESGELESHGNYKFPHGHPPMAGHMHGRR